MTTRLLRSFLLGLGSLLLVLGGLVPTSADDGAPTLRKNKGLDYVAMGDSFSAASGVLPLAPTAPPQCLQSTRNYPHLVAAKLRGSFVDVSCGGADTSDYRSSQSPGVPKQIAAVSRTTDLVTMTIGGNDSGVFISAIVQCGAEGLASLGIGSPCKDRYGSSFTDTVRNKTHFDIVRALRLVKRKAPKARIAILGYPWILPKSEGCYPQMPIARGDVPYLRNLQGVLNKQIRRAAKKVKKVRYVNLNRVSNGRDACESITKRWVEPVVAGSNPVIVHPNARGERGMFRRVMRVMKLR